jgi:hypothetical protein
MKPKRHNSFSQLCCADDFLINGEAEPPAHLAHLPTRIGEPTARSLALFCGPLLSRSLSFGCFFLRFAPHLHERVDQVVDWLMLFRLASHPYEGVEKILNGLAFFCHASS